GTMESLRLALGERSYPIHIGERILGSTELYAPYLAGGSAAVVTNTVVAPLYLDTVCGALETAGARVARIVLADGEQAKEWGTLDTLPDRELRAGLAEVIKHGLALDEAFVSWLEGNVEKLLARDRFALSYAIRRCCELKAQVVSADEREAGSRALLNFGHTFG